VARAVARNLEHAVRQEHSEVDVRQSVQVVVSVRCCGLLVMRR
jgi:hypothetical protein